MNNRFSRRPKEVLIIDNDASAVSLLQTAFDRTLLWCNVHVAQNSGEALKHLYETAGSPRRTDLILINIETTPGEDLLVRIKSHPVTHVVPVIVIAPTGAHDEVERAYRLMANCCVAKSTDLNETYDAFVSLAAFWLRTAKLPGY
jgi:DNA-binding NtrC family response regulator